MEFASPVVELVTNFVVNRSKRLVNYIRHYKRNVDELDGSVKDLGRVKERVNHHRDEAEKNLYNIEDAVIEWFRKVDELESKAAAFKNDEGRTKTQFYCFWNRYRLAKQAQKMAEDVKKLIDESPKFGEIAYRENVTSNDATLSNAGFMEFGSTKSTMEKIMAQLEDSTVRMIGLYGPGGVGKSTLIKAVAKKARDEKLFKVPFLEITANDNLQKIQEDMAYQLELKLDGESENVRADCLRRRLKKEKENTLVILDGLRDKLDINKLGILLDDDDDNDDVDDDSSKRSKQNAKQDPKPKKEKSLAEKYINRKVEKSLGDCKRCKILLTSRYKKVLSDHIMNDDSIFTLKKLDDKDALMLFRKMARIPDEISTSKEELVKNYCEGLPLTIVAVGIALRDKSESVWEATLEELKKQEPAGEIVHEISNLENEELKSILLLCAQMSHQPLIMDLVKYCYALGVLEGVSSFGEARERIHTSIQKLRQLDLVDDYSSNDFKMQHRVRDAALSIAYKERNVFTLRNGKLDDWRELERCTSISICFSDVIDELPNDINCPQLKFLQIESDDPSLKIPENFFETMKKLRVLILTGIHLSSLPKSFENLSNLRMICLERCTLDCDLSIIGALKKLTILSFSGSQMKCLPIQLGCLDKLQLLDISNCSTIETIPPDIISRLTCLEELYIRESLIKMLVDRETNQSQISFLSDLKHLHQLKVMDLSIPCAAILPKNLFFDNLNDYKIVIGDFKVLSVGDFRMPNMYEALRSLALQLKDATDIQSWEGIKLLFKRVENMLLGELNGVVDVINELNLDGFQDLKHLSITNNTHIKYIINSTDSHHTQEVFPNLESLCLYKLWSIETICCSLSFAKLKTIKVEMCAQLKNLFSFCRNKFLGSLETIDVFECNSLKDIIEIPVNCVKVEFLMLHSLTLQSLPSFTSFCTIIEDTDHIEITTADDKRSDMAPCLFGERVEIPNLESLNLSSVNIDKIWSDQPISSFCFQNLKKLVVKDCNKLRYLCSLSVANGLRKLECLFISGCPNMDKIFGMEGHSAHKVYVFPNLKEIHLSKMSMLSDIWHTEVSFDSFSSLISVHVEGCEKLDKIFPSHMEGWFASLDSLKVVDCKSVEVIFEINGSQKKDASGGIDTNLQHIDIRLLPKLKQVWSKDLGGILNFKKLLSIEVSSCHKLRNIFPASVAKDARRLEYMSIQSCEKVAEIVARGDGSETQNEPSMFPKLTKMMLNSLSNVECFCWGRHAIECPKLKRLVVKDCKKLKAFPTEPSKITTEEEKPVFLDEKVFPNLEYLDIDFDEAQKWLWSNIQKYQMYHLKELSLISAKSGECLCRQNLYRMPNLEKLHLFRTEHLLKEPSVPCLGTVLHLKELVLWFSEVKDLGFERDPVLQRLKLLSLRTCHNLNNLAPPSVSLTNLTYLEVNFCRELTSLMAFSTAKSLVQLKTMKVIGCDNAKEIVTTDGSEEGILIVFSKLITIQLVELKNLTSFCNSKNCEFKFPSLKILILRECPMMKTFSHSPASTPKLQNILAVEGKEESKWQWEGDLNATVQKVFNDKDSFKYTKDLYLYHYPQLIEQLWQSNHSVQQSIFRNLKMLNVFKCNRLKHVIPSHLIPCFENLEELQVLCCSAAQVIFNIKEISWKTKALGIFRLKKLSLAVLPELVHVWDKDPEGIIGLQALQHMHVSDCRYLKSLFPASVAKDLTGLEELKVTKCEQLEEIFSEDEEAKGGEFVFSCLTSLKQIPSLKKLSFGIGDSTVTCDRESRQLHFHKWQEESDSVPLYVILDMLPIIEKLACKNCSFKEMFSAEILQLKEIQVEKCGSLKKLVAGTASFSNLTFLEVASCRELTYLFTSSTAKSLAQLKRMKIKSCESVEEIVSKEGDETHKVEKIEFGQLQVLFLERLRQLRCFYPGKFTLSFPSLEQVHVIDCSSMETFSPVNEIHHSTKWFSSKNAKPKEENDLNSAVGRGKRHMADQSPEHHESPSDGSPKATRRATRLKDLAKRRAYGHRTPVDIDVRTGIASGPNAKIFQSYLGFLVREHVSILLPSWDHVTEIQRNMLWQDLLLTFDIPNVESLRLKVMSSMSIKFRQFKSILTSKYIYDKQPDEICMPDYKAIDEETWEKFVQSRLSKEWQAKRKKAKDIQSNNVCPHVLSRGGYKVLEERMLLNNQRQREEASASDPSISMVGPPSPPSRHEKWKLARLKKSGEYTSSGSRSIAEKIDSLVEESSQGSFMPHGRNDILAAAIGKPEHPGRVRAIGQGLGIRQYFGNPGYTAVNSAVSQQTIDSLRQSITEEVTQNLRKQITMEVAEQVRLDIMQQLGLQSLSRGTPSQVKQPAVGVSTKGSCSPDEGSLEDGAQYGLYVDEKPIRLVAIGRVLGGGETIHCMPIADGVVRVTVEEAHDSGAPLPLPTDELHMVGQALSTFIAWPKYLVKPLTTKIKTPKKKVSPKKPSEPIDDPLECMKELALNMRSKNMGLPWDPQIFGRDINMPLYIHMSDCVEIYSGMDEINITQMQLWIMFLSNVSTEMGNNNVYGFLEPQSIMGLADKSPNAKTYIMDWIGVANKRIYLAPYLDNGHWQLIVLCPSDHVVVFFCSLHKALPDKLKKVLEGIHVGHYMLISRSRSRPKLRFIIPKPNRQSERPQCGFYVMQWMENIIRMAITNNWLEIFSCTDSFSEEVIDHTRKQWARFLLECRKDNTIESESDS